MALEGKLKKTERLKDGDRNITYDVVFEEVSRKRVYPEDEMREIILDAMRQVKRNMDLYPGMYELRVSLDPLDEASRLIMEELKKKFRLTLEPLDQLNNSKDSKKP